MPGSKGETVVMVEDDPSMCQALERLLRLGGFVPRIYGSAELLLANGGNDQAICVIADVQLPGMDGFAMHERLIERGDVLPVIFITAFDEPEAREHAAKAGSAFLAKPFSGRALLETIRTIRR